MVTSKCLCCTPCKVKKWNFTEQWWANSDSFLWKQTGEGGRWGVYAANEHPAWEQRGEGNEMGRATDYVEFKLDSSGMEIKEANKATTLHVNASRWRRNELSCDEAPLDQYSFSSISRTQQHRTKRQGRQLNGKTVASNDVERGRAAPQGIDKNKRPVFCSKR